MNKGHTQDTGLFTDICFTNAKLIIKSIMTNDMIKHYDKLVDENNDPVHDPKPLRDYMDKWDGQRFIDCMKLDKFKSVLEIGSEPVVLQSKQHLIVNAYMELIFLQKRYKEPLKIYRLIIM